MMGKAACAFVCLLLVLPILAQPPALPLIVVENLTDYAIQYMHHVLYKAGSVLNTETFTLFPGESYELVVDDDIFQVVTSYGLVRPAPLPPLFNQNNEWTVQGSGEPEPSVHWTIHEDGFWLSYGEGNAADEQLICNWQIIVS